jgi:hypothetical protein
MRCGGSQLLSGEVGAKGRVAQGGEEGEQGFSYSRWKLEVFNRQHGDEDWDNPGGHQRG